MDEEEQLIRQGEDAEVLLGTEVFSKTIDVMVHGAFQSFVNSKVEDTAAREETFHHYRALVGIVSTLQQQVSVKNEIITKNVERNNSKEVE